MNLDPEGYWKNAQQQPKQKQTNSALIPLLGCPFCGQPPHELSYKNKTTGGRKFYYVACGNDVCPSSPNTDGYSKLKKAREAWNTRAT